MTDKWTLGAAEFTVDSDDIRFTLDEYISAQTLGADNYLVLVDASSGNIKITLPAAADHANRVYIIKKIDSTNHTVTIDANATEKIEWEEKLVFGLQGDFVRITTNGVAINGTEWFIIGGVNVKMETLLENIEGVLRDSLERQDRSLLILGKLEKHTDETNTVEVDEEEIEENLREMVPEVVD